MVTKDELKKEVDRLPENLLEEVYALLKQIVQRKNPSATEDSWIKWKASLDKFTPDFMKNAEHLPHQSRELFD